MIPITNPYNKEIKGCKNEKETKHERAHIIYLKSYKGMRNEYIKQTCEYYALISIILGHWINQFNYCALILILISIYLYTYEEVYCNIYADKKVKVKKIPNID
jgi:hypothetical protein